MVTCRRIAETPCHRGLEPLIARLEVACVPPLLLSLLLVCCAIRVASGGTQCHPQRVCGFKTVAYAWDSLLLTIGIQLGWGFKATYDTTTNLFQFRRNNDLGFSLALLGLITFTLVLLMSFRLLFRKRQAVQAPPKLPLSSTKC